MLNILNKIEEIKKADRAGKILLLQGADDTFKKFLQLTFDSSKTYGVSSVKRTEPVGADLFEYLDYLSTLPSIKSAHKTELYAIASQSDAHFEVARKILRRNADCGIDNKSIEKALPGLVPYFPYMRCSGVEKLPNIKYPAYSQQKCDQMFVNMFVNNGEIVFKTRNGKQLLFKHFTHTSLSDGVYMGEILYAPGGNVAQRAIGNATICKSLTTGMSEEEENALVVAVWDKLITAESYKEGFLAREYSMRMIDAAKAITEANDKRFFIVESRLVYSEKEVFAHYDSMRSRGLEGTVVKDMKGYWEDGTSGLQVKIKAVKECEVRITGWNKGKKGGKYASLVGSFIVESHDGGLVSSVSGMDDAVRWMSPDDFLQKVITVKFNDVSKAKNSDTYAFSHANFVEFREDRDTADTTEYIINL